MAMTMTDILSKLVNEHNTYAELVALNKEKIKEGKCDEATLQWNRGSLNRIKTYLEELAEGLGVTVTYTYGSYPFGYDDWKRMLEWRKAEISPAEWEKLTK